MKKQNFYDLSFNQLKRFLIDKAEVESKKAKMRSQQLFNAVYKKNIKDFDELTTFRVELRDKIKWWDQDVLNVLVDGNYLELKKDFNMKASEIKGMPDESVVFLHYAGKGKPWDNSFFEDPNTNIYQNAFLRTGFSEYHIDPKGFIENILFFKHLFSNKYKQFNKKKLFSSYIKNKLI